MIGRIALGFIVLALLAPGPAAAHKPSDSYLSLTVADGAIDGRWDIALRDLEHAIGLDSDQDGVLTWGEVRARHDDIAAYALARLAIEADGAPCTTRPLQQLVDRHSDGAYTVLRFAADCPGAVEAPTLTYDLFFDLDPTHRGLVHVAHVDGTQAAVFSPEQRQLTIVGASNTWRQVRDFGAEGVWHIWIGFDHILFLISLLLPAVQRYRDGAWRPVASLPEAFVEVVKVVTAFTIAHSVTLGLATLGWVTLPAHVVEPVIAASIVAAALNNVIPVVTRGLWAVAFGFGLIHGLGFAGALQDLGLPPGGLLTPLLSFNLGVELGQLAIVSVFLPVAYALRRSAFYPRAVLQAGSILIAAVAGLWFVERVLGQPLLTL